MCTFIFCKRVTKRVRSKSFWQFETPIFFSIWYGLGLNLKFKKCPLHFRKFKYADVFLILNILKGTRVNILAISSNFFPSSNKKNANFFSVFSCWHQWNLHCISQMARSTKSFTFLTQNCVKKATNGLQRQKSSLFCTKLCKKVEIDTVKRKIGKKFIKSRENIYQLQKHWQFIIIFLQLNFFPVFFRVEFIPPLRPKYSPLERDKTFLPCIH